MESFKCDKYKSYDPSSISFPKYLGCNWFICSVQTKPKPRREAWRCYFAARRCGAHTPPQQESRAPPLSWQCPYPSQWQFSRGKHVRQNSFLYKFPVSQMPRQLHSKPIATQPLASCHSTTERRWRGHELGPSPSPTFPEHSPSVALLLPSSLCLVMDTKEFAEQTLHFRLLLILDRSWRALLPNLHL